MKQKILLLVLVGFILILPIHQAQAASFWDGFGIALQKIVASAFDLYAIPAAIGLQIVQMITGILPVVAGELFRVVLNLNNEIALTPLGAGPKDMVTVGFNFTRDLANMLFILILAWVGFATILRIETYEVKKIIPKLVIIALLINFIPVITGVILDIASIITKIFADKSTGIALYMWNLLPGVSMVQKGTASLTALIPGQGGISGMAVASLMGIVFNLIAAFMLSLYGLLFIMRIAIWILIILAPLAWLGYIIPQGKKMWDMWWKQFIQWAIIGIPLTFFLYLTTFVLSSSSFVCDIDNAAAFEQYGFLEGLLTGLVGENLICNPLPFFAGIVVMLAGFILSISFAPSGADAVIKGAKKGGLVAAKVGGTAFTKGPLKDYGKGLENYLARPYRSVRDEMNTRVRARGGWKNPKSWVSGAAPGLGIGLGKGVGETFKDTARHLTPPPPKHWGPLIKGSLKASAKDGMVKALKDSAKAGWVAGIGGKTKKKKGPGGKSEKLVKCPTCNTDIAESAPTCPKCGAKFEL